MATRVNFGTDCVLASDRDLSQRLSKSSSSSIKYVSLEEVSIAVVEGKEATFVEQCG